ncbi:hypothetical protein FB45DRAFT_1022955 [Roridomyces roridus]|uniref:Uncharacterized protein n=1 Tax=Roridomyces roridus TaxID=1738132 RepID=A0AAD7C9L2_9AGAR|nr:hypothetical protein FB45DRAFT_1022955 [Roridomyces roridus]
MALWPSYGSASVFLMKEFVRWLGYVLEGKIEDKVVMSTVKSYIFGYFAVWNQYAGIIVPKEYQFEATSNLSSKCREKPIADLIDLEAIILGILQDTTTFKTHRSCIDMIYSILLSCLSSERPGALVESGCYRGSNKALLCGDHEFSIVPNSADPSRPFVVVILHPDLLKGYREDDSQFKSFFIQAEPSSHRHIDASMYGLVAAFDPAFESPLVQAF